MRNKLIASLFFCGGLLLTAAGSDDLHLNGHFRGAPPGAVIAPGWTASAGAATRLLPDRAGKAILEVAAPVNAATVVASGLHEARGRLLKLKVEIQGRGTASIGFEAFDSYRNRVIASDRRQFQAGPHFRDAKAAFDLFIPNISYVRIVLVAEPGSVIRFRDVEAEFMNPPATPPPPVAPQPPVVPPVTPSPIAVAPAPAPGTIPPGTLPLVNDRFYSYSSLRDVEVTQVTLPIGSDIEFDLQEHVDRRIYWQLISYDPAICRIKLEHDRDGVWPMRYEKSDIKIKGIAPGYSVVEFAAGSKRFIVHVTVR